MAKRKPTTKLARRRKVSKVLREQKAGTLRTAAGTKPVSQKQAVAIALSEAGLSKKKRKRSKA